MSQLTQEEEGKAKAKFEKWRQKFLQSNSGKLAINAMKEKIGRYHPEDYSDFEAAVFTSCYYASLYNPQEDPLFQRRMNERKEIPQLLKRQIEAVEVIEDFIHSYPEDFMRTMPPSYTVTTHEKDARNVCKSSTGMVRPFLLLQDLLTLYKSGLSAGATCLQRGPFLHRFQAGNMLFVEPKDRKNSHNLPSPETMLAFELAMRFRRWTNPEWIKNKSATGNPHLCIPNYGEPMPKYGKPHHALIEKLVNATLGCDLDEAKVKSTLSKIAPGTGLASWPLPKVEDHPPKK